jgi:hypothetical protein
MSLTTLIRSIFGTRGEPAKSPPRTARHHFISNPWHAVSIAPSPGACPKARSMVRARFLSQDAPALPLEECSSKVCACRYVHHQDRRRTLRRASDVVPRRMNWPGQERRNTLGRRSTDMG